MDVDSTGATWAILIATLLLYAIIAVAESALNTVSRSRLRALAETGDGGAEGALKLLDDPTRLRDSLVLLRRLLTVILTVSILLLAQAFQQSVPGVVLGSWAALLLLDALAGAIGARWYLPFAARLAPLLSVLLFLTAPLRRALTALRQRLGGAPMAEEAALRLSEEERRLLASVVGEERAELPDEGREMLYSIVTLSQTTVREVMVPRPDLVAMRGDISMRDALDTVIREGHSRIPIYEENIDNIVGILYAKDLLAYLHDGRTDVSIRDMARPVLFVPSSKMADELLEELQRRRVHLAIVFDEYGGTAGLVTIEDILEEIVGEIQDEYDTEEEALNLLTPFEAMVSGRLDIDDLNHEMDLSLPTDENDTVGGLIYSALGRVPLLNDEVRMEEAGVTFRVMAMAGRRIQKVRVLVDRPPSDEEEDAEPTLREVPDDSPSPSGSVAVSLSRLMFW